MMKTVKVGNRSFSMKKVMIFSPSKEYKKEFTSVSTDEDFRKYAHTVMKEAHGDQYSEDVTNKVVDDLLKDNQGADYGELIGRLTSGFGQKSFSDRTGSLYLKNEGNRITIRDLGNKVKNLGGTIGWDPHGGIYFYGKIDRLKLLQQCISEPTVINED